MTLDPRPDTAAIAKRWRQFSKHYESHVYSVTSFAEKRSKIVATVRGSVILDLGCGPLGLVLRDLIQAGRAGAIGLDLTDAMVLQSRSATADLGIKHVVGDFRALPLQSSSVDTVIAVNSLMPETRRECRMAFAEVSRILRPGGRLTALLPAFEMSLITRDRWQMPIRLDVKNHREWDTVGWQSYYTVSDIEQLASAAGFRSYRIERVEFSSPEEIDQVRDVYSSGLRGVPLDRLYRDPLFEHLLIADL